jgi:hypothetical protein
LMKNFQDCSKKYSWSMSTRRSKLSVHECKIHDSPNLGATYHSNAALGALYSSAWPLLVPDYMLEASQTLLKNKIWRKTFFLQKNWGQSHRLKSLKAFLTQRAEPKLDISGAVIFLCSTVSGTL